MHCGKLFGNVSKPNPSCQANLETLPLRSFNGLIEFKIESGKVIKYDPIKIQFNFLKKLKRYYFNIVKNFLAMSANLTHPGRLT